MLGWQIFWSSIMLLFLNFSSAVRITSPILLSYAALVVFISQSFENSVAVILARWAIIIAYFFAISWSVVSWHRFLLIGERPNGALPKLHLRRTLGYLGWTLLIILIQAPFIIFERMSSSELDTAANPAPLFIAIFLVTLFGIWLGFRICLVLPAVAVGKKIKLGESWQATKPIAGTIIVLSLILILASVIIGIISALATSNNIVQNLVINGAVNWCILMVTVSIMTTLYAHLVEDRKLR